MKKIIKKAIEGGYKPSEVYLEETAYGADYQFHAIFTDPLFWQALGKACGWESNQCEKCKSTYPEYINGCVRCGGHVSPDKNHLHYSLRFHELNITQGWNEAVKWLEELVVKE